MLLLGGGRRLGHGAVAVEDRVGFDDEDLGDGFAVEVSRSTECEGVGDGDLAVDTAEDLGIAADDGSLEGAFLANNDFAGALEVALDGAVNTDIGVRYDSSNYFTARSEGIEESSGRLLCHFRKHD